MLRKLALISAVSVVAMGTALAQQPTPPTTPPSSSPSMSQDSTSSSASPQFIAAQKPDQWLGSKFKGTDVLGSDNQKVGDISDMVFDKSGKIDAYVVSVGGFLGIGSKEVALAPNAFQVVPGDPNSATNSSPKLKISMNKDQLKAAPNFERYKEPSRATTGTTGAPRPASGGMNR
jgi:sporulation protein YlmC with PRC-barrel domain